MDGLTPDDIKTLQAPLPLADHEAREKAKSKDGTKKQYLIYINQEGVIPLLNSIDPNWSWDVLNVHFEDKYVAVTGRLTIKGVARDGVGGNSPNRKEDPVDEDTVKGAETDALKRAALRFGVGLYLRSTPVFWIDAELPPWKAADAAIGEFGAWYKRAFGAQQPPNGQQAPSTPKNAPAPQNGAGNGIPPKAPTASPELTPAGQPTSAASPDTEPDADGFRRYLVHEVIVNEMPNGGRQYVAKSEMGDNIVTFGGEAFQDAGFDTSKWPANGRANKVDPAAIIEAKFTGKKWEIRSVEVAF